MIQSGREGVFMKKSRFSPYIRGGITAFAVVLVSLITYFLMFHMQVITDHAALLRQILRPVSMGLVFAFLLLPIHNRIYGFFCDQFAGKKGLTRRKKSLFKGVSILLSLIFAFAVLYVLLAMVIPQVYISVVGLIKSIPDYINTAQQWVMKFLEDNPDIQAMAVSAFTPMVMSLEDWLNNEIIPNLSSVSQTLEWMKGTLLPNISGVISNVSSLVKAIVLWAKDIFIGVIVSVYLLASKDTFAAQTKKIVYSLLPTRYGDLLVEETRNAYRIMSGFINGKLLDSLIIGIIAFICCNLFKFPYAALIAVIIGVTNIIPFFGPFIGAIPSAFLILLVDPVKYLYFCLFVFLLQQFDGNILGPKILGESTGLASFWVLFSILLFGGLFGFPGMVLGVPCFAIFYSVMKRLVDRGLRKKGLPQETGEYMGLTGRFSHQPSPLEDIPEETPEAPKEEPAPEPKKET